MKNINDILAHYEEQPPAECWDKLSSHLDKIMPTSGTAASTDSVAAKGAAATLSKGVIASIVGAVAVATITLVAVTLTHKSPSEEPTASNQTNIVTDSTQIKTDDETSILLTEAIEKEVSNTKQADEETASNTTLPEQPTDKPANDISARPTNPAATPSNPVVSVQPTAATVTPQAISHIQPSVTKAALPKNSTIVQQQHNDPVIQSHNEEEDFNWSPPAKIEIPNVFTPNGDGYNEFFVIKGLESCTKRQLVVRNRSGKIVYRSNNYENNWNGDNCPDGNYIYQLFYNNNGIDQSVGGTVAIIRK